MFSRCLAGCLGGERFGPGQDVEGGGRKESPNYLACKNQRGVLIAGGEHRDGGKGAQQGTERRGLKGKTEHREEPRRGMVGTKGFFFFKEKGCLVLNCFHAT